MHVKRWHTQMHGAWIQWIARIYGKDLNFHVPTELLTFLNVTSSIFIQQEGILLNDDVYEF